MTCTWHWAFEVWMVFFNFSLWKYNDFKSSFLINHLYHNSVNPSVHPSVCHSAYCFWTNGRISFIFGTNIKHIPGILQIFVGDLKSKVKVTSEVKVIPKIKSAGNLMKRVENWKSHFQFFHINLTFLVDLVIFGYSGALVQWM